MPKKNTKKNKNKIKVKTNQYQYEIKPDLTKKSTEKREKIEKEAEEEREDEIEESLSEIYQDNKGKMVDVEKLKITKKRGFVFWFFNFLIIGMVLIVLALGAYYYIFYSSGTDSQAIEFLIDSEKTVSANEEFLYTIRYKNLSYVALRNVTVQAEYPENFIFLESTPHPENEENNFWKLGRVGPRSEGEIKVKGKIIDQPKISSIMIAKIIYMPENFSSEFEKEASFNTVIKDIGFEVLVDYFSTVLVDEESEVVLNFKTLENNFIEDFIVKMETEENIKIIETVVNDGADEEEDDLSLTVEKIDEEANIWRVSDLGEKEEKFAIRYEINDKISDNQKIKFLFEKEEGEEDNLRNIVFFEKEIDIEVMKSDLNLILVLNGSQEDQTVDFEEELNYSIAFANKGEATLNNVSIMMVLDSEFLDWTSLVDENMGKERGNTIAWTSDEIPTLERVEVEDEGVIDFSIKVSHFSENDLAKDFQIISYSQYNISSIEKLGDISTSSMDTSGDDLDNRSNTIVSRINSDLKLKEEIRYFDANNMPVGTGPLPPQVGEKSSFKVYWTLNNNLHELRDVQISSILPEGVWWDEKNRTSVGNISYEEDTKKVIWQIGRLPITVFRADAEFNISITPREEDRNKIMVLSTGAKTEAVDDKTGDTIERITSAKTTKLEDDDIASLSSDGRVK